MTTDTLILKAYELIKESDIFHDRLELEWASYLLNLYEKGWLYSAIHRGQILAVAGAYRISKWQEGLRNSIPEREQGKILYVPFLVSHARDNHLPLKFLKHYLNQNSEVKEIIFFDKYKNIQKKQFKVIRRNKVRLNISAPSLL